MTKAKALIGPNGKTKDANLSNVFHLDSVREAIKIAESERSLEDYQSGKPSRIARTNIWTDVKQYLQGIEKQLEQENKEEAL